MGRFLAITRRSQSALAAAVLLVCAFPLLGRPLHAQAIHIQKPVAGLGLHRNSIQGSTTVAISVTPTSVSFALVNGATATANNAIAITSTLNMPLDTTLQIYGYFVSAASALTGNVSSVNIATSSVYGIVPTGLPTSYTAFTQTGPFGAAGTALQLISVGGITSEHVETDNLTLRIDLSGITIPADTYVGTLYIQAQAF